jgi:ATP-dependent protease ClpP protease subunit
MSTTSVDELADLVAGIIQKPKEVWDKFCPIVTEQDNLTTHVYLTDSIEMPAEYDELCYKLKFAKEDETFILHINTPGGVIDAALAILDAIANTKARVIGALTGTVASAGTIIALSCHELEVAKYSSFMIHNYSGGTSGKGHEMKAYQNFVDAELNKTFKEIYKGFLTDDEMDSVIDGKDMWMGRDEVLTRWNTKHEKA